MAANRKGIGPTMLKRACYSTTNTRTKYLSVVMHKTLCSVWLTFVRRENETDIEGLESTLVVHVPKLVLRYRAPKASKIL